MKNTLFEVRPLFFMLVALTASCGTKNTRVAKEAIHAINLKQGEVVLCGPPDKQFGTVGFVTSCSQSTKKDFDLAMALLHSFEYEEAEKVFAKVIADEPGCAMAYWGVAMCNYHQVWPSPPTPAELEKGSKAILVAQSLKQQSSREAGYIQAMATFYKDWGTTGHPTRSLNFRQAMEKVYQAHPEDKEAAVLYALSLIGSANPMDKSYQSQKKAGAILTALYPGEPNHPGVVHYLIHTYDATELAALALPAARKYASIAPASAHAQHMPSHIFTRLGLWDECIQSNLVSTAAAKCYAENAGIKGHWDEELHGMDYLVYAYLQKGQNDLAREQLNYLNSIQEVYPANFKVAYAFAAIPARYFLENSRWKEAAGMAFHPGTFPWHQFPWQKAIVHFARLMGAVHTGNTGAAHTELQRLHTIHDTLAAQQEVYKANQVMIQIKSGEAWILYGEKKPGEALRLMNTAAGLEDKTEKSPVTPGEVIPAKELLADLLLLLDRPAEALAAYEADLKKRPNRFNGLYGAAVASEKCGYAEKARDYYRQLISQAGSTGKSRKELESARLFLQQETD